MQLEKQAADEKYAEEARIARDKLAQEFDNVLSEIAQEILATAEDLKSKSSDLFNRSESGEAQAREVVGQTQESHSVLETLSRCSADMTSSVQAIMEQATTSTNLTHSSVEQVGKAHEEIEGLSQSLSRRVSRFAETIRAA